MMPAKSLRIAAFALATHALCASAGAAAQSDEARNLNELRNTVVNLLQGLVEKGVLTREQAAAMVNAAQSTPTNAIYFSNFILLFLLLLLQFNLSRVSKH